MSLSWAAAWRGLSAAIELADRGFAVTLLEARDVGSGASGRNGGQALPSLACEPHVIEAQLGLEVTRIVWDAGIEALEPIHRRCPGFAIAGEWRSGHLLTAVSARKARRLRATTTFDSATFTRRDSSGVESDHVWYLTIEVTPC